MTGVVVALGWRITFAPLASYWRDHVGLCGAGELEQAIDSILRDGGEVKAVERAQ